MNRYDEYYNFRLAKVEDVDKIMQFIHDEWNENHILAHDKEFFLWMYGRNEYGDNENINFVLMTDKQGEILGMQGFVAYSNDKEKLDIAPSMTKVKSKGLLPMTGLELMKRGHMLLSERHQISFGTNPRTIKPLFEKAFKYRVGVMQQYYMLNDKMDEYVIASISDYSGSVKAKTSDRSIASKNEWKSDDEYHQLREIHSIEESEFDLCKDYARLPYKSKEYINKRYFEHPIYQYKTWEMLTPEGKVVALLFGREINQNGAKVLRIVDFRGEIEYLYKIGKPLSEIMYAGNYEYVDLMTDRLDSKKMEENGFRLLDVNGDNIIPNYFEPFVRENITVHYENDGDCVIFKADGDQDRPNHR